MKKNIKNRKITLLIDGFVAGGAQRVAIQLIDYLSSNNYDVKLITMKSKEHDFFKINEEIERISIDGNINSKNIIHAFYNNIVRVAKVRSALKKQRTEVFISFLTSNNIILIIASAFLRKTVIISERNDPSRQKHNTCWNFLRKSLYKYADQITTNSAISVETIKKYAPFEKIILIENPIKIPKHNSSEPSKDNRRILTVGRLVEQKNHIELLHAFDLLLKRNRDWKLRIIGEGPERKKIEDEVCKRNLTEQVSLPGLQKNVELEYKKASIFVLTSKFEGTPNTLLEAIANHVPCIVADCLPGALNYIEHGVSGFVYSSGKPQELAHFIEKLANSDELKRTFSKNALEKIDNLSINNIGEKWESIINK